MPPADLNPLNNQPEDNNATPNPPVLHPADNLYLYTLYAETPRIPLRPGHPPIPSRRPRASPGRYQLSFQPNSLVRLKAIDCVSALEVTGRCWDFIDGYLPRTPIMQPGNPNIDDRPTSFFLDSPGFEGKAILSPAGNVREMADWTMRILATAATVLSLVFPPAEGLKFSLIADDEDPQRQVIDDDIYLPLYYKKNESGITRVTESLVSLVVVQMTPWAFSGWDILDFLHLGQFRRFDVNSDGEVSNPDSLNRVEKVWARLWSDCASVKCPFFILTNSKTWILGCFYSGWTRAICFRLLEHGDHHPSIMQWIVFWCASALGAPNSWLPGKVRMLSNPDLRVPLRLQPGVPKFADMDDRQWVDQLVKCHDPSIYPTEHADHNVWNTSFSNRFG